MNPPLDRPTLMPEEPEDIMNFHSEEYHDLDNETATARHCAKRKPMCGIFGKWVPQGSSQLMPGVNGWPNSTGVSVPGDGIP